MSKKKGRKDKQTDQSFEKGEEKTKSAPSILSPVFYDQFKEDLRWWATNNKKVYEKVFALIEDILDGDPFKGKGHPEPLKYMGYSGVWSRRIDQEHRLVYRVHDRKIHFLQARYHYQ